MLITPPRFVDARGFFSETWNAERFADAGIPGPFVQDNHALSTERGVLRGLHLPDRRRTRKASWCAWCAARSGTWRWTCGTARRRFGQHVGGGAERGELAAAVGAGRVPARLLHARPRITEVIYKVTGAVRSRGRARGDLERSGPGPALADAAGEAAAVGQGHGAAAAGGLSGLVHRLRWADREPPPKWRSNRHDRADPGDRRHRAGRLRAGGGRSRGGRRSSAGRRSISTGRRASSRCFARPPRGWW